MTCTISKPMYLGDVGTTIRLTVTEDGAAVDISDWTSVVFRFRPPQGVSLDLPGTVEDAPNGLVSYTTEDGDIDQVGRWFVEVTVTTPTWTNTSTPASFIVRATLPAPPP